MAALLRTDHDGGESEMSGQKAFARDVFVENMQGRMVLIQAAKHILQGSSCRYDSEGELIPSSAPEAFWIVYHLICSLDADFKTAKFLSSARKAANR